MAERCSACGSDDTSPGLAAYTCLICGKTTEYDGLSEKGVTADNSSYAGDDGATFHGDPPREEKPKPKAKAKAK